jgi:hypothetical protein
MENTKRIIQGQHSAQQRNKLSLWTVYDHPVDFPNSYVARRFEVNADGPVATGDLIQGELDAIRKSFHQAGLTCLTRNEGDEPQIVESWL